MTVKSGQYAKVMLDVAGTPTQVMELREWSVSGSTEKIDSSAAGAKSKTHIIGMFSWEGEATCISADQYWLDLIENHVTIDFFDAASDANPAYTGEASIDFERNAPYEDVIESSLTFTGNGDLVHPVVTP